MKHYELLFVLRPTLTEEEAKVKVDFIKEVLEKNGAQIAARHDMGMRKLAYAIKKFERGNYTVFYFQAPPSAIGEVERIIRITEEIIKFLTVKYENKKEVAHWERSVAAALGKGKKDEAATAEVVEAPAEAPAGE
jgi:small subunit ribosomal protein S6